MKKMMTALLSLVAALCLCFGLAACGENGGGRKITGVFVSGVGGNKGSGISVGVGKEESLMVDFLMDVYGKKPAHELKCTASENGIVQLVAETDVEFEDEDGDIRDNVDRLTVKGLAPGKTTVTISVGEGEGLSFSFEVVVENYTKGLEYGEADPWGWNTETHGIACVGLGTATETDIHVPSHAYWDGQWLTVSQVKLNKEEDGARITSVHLPEWTIAVDLAYSHIQSLALPEGVEMLHENAFKGCSLLEEITLPAGLTQIQESVFENCTSLGSLDIPASVSIISDRAFANCTSLKKLVIPEDCSIGTDFLAGSGVKDLELPYLHPGIWCEWDERLDHFTGLERLAIDLGSYASYLPDAVLTDLKELVVKGGVVDSDKFRNNCHKLTSVTFLGKVTKIGADAFTELENLETVTFEDGATEIGDTAFQNCLKLKTAIFSDTLERFGEHVFRGCKELETVRVGERLEQIGGEPFFGCSKIKNVTTSRFTFMNGGQEYGIWSIFPLLDFSVEPIGECALITLTIPEGVHIPAGALGGFDRLEALVLPSSLTSLSSGIATELGGLRSAHNLKTVTVAGEGGKFRKQDGILYFRGENGVPSIVWADGDIAGAVGILDGVTSLPELTFSGCAGITSISIPSSVQTIGDNVFKGCEALTEIRFGGAFAAWNAIDGSGKIPAQVTLHCTDGDYDSQGRKLA